MTHFRLRTSGFTLVELLIGMLIFAIGLTGVFALLQTTQKNSWYSRHEVIIANLLREQVELVVNARNTNVRSFIPFDRLSVERVATVDTFSWVYILENDFSSPVIQYDALGKIQKSPVYAKAISFGSTDLAARFSRSRLYIDANGRYTHTVTPTPTPYASYTEISPLSLPTPDVGIVKHPTTGKIQGYQVRSRVIVSSQWYREYDLSTFITDWK